RWLYGRPGEGIGQYLYSRFAEIDKEGLGNRTAGNQRFPAALLPDQSIDIVLTNGKMPRMNWEEIYQKGEVFWNKGAPSPPMKQYLERHAVRGRAIVPGCGHGHEVALAVEHGLDAIGLDIAPTAVAKAR